MITNNFKEAAYSQETDLAVIILLTLKTSGGDVRVCSTPIEKYPDLGENIYGCTSNGERFLFFPFTLTLPQDDKTGAVSAKLTIENIDRQIVQYARQARGAITVNIQCVLSNNPDVIELEFNDFKLTNVSYNAFSLSGNISVDYLGLEPFPCGRFTPSGFPGLF